MSRLTILAGAGALVPEVIAGARARGDEVQVLLVAARPDMPGAEVWGLSRFMQLIAAIREFNTTDLVMAGAVTLGDDDRAALARLAGGAEGGRGDAALSKLSQQL